MRALMERGRVEGVIVLACVGFRLLAPLSMIQFLSNGINIIHFFVPALLHKLIFLRP